MPRPSFVKDNTEKGSKAAGIRYENKVVNHLKKSYEIIHGPWIQFIDEKMQWAQPDIIVLTENKIYCIECKLTWKRSGLKKLIRFYKPLLENIFKLPVQCVMIYKNSKPGFDGEVINALEETKDLERAYSLCLRF